MARTEDLDRRENLNRRGDWDYYNNRPMASEKEPPEALAGSEIHPAPSEFTQAQIATDPILHFFHYSHLPETLRPTSRLFMILAHTLIVRLPRNAERTVALRKLLEAKDAAVRANLPGPRDFHTNKRMDAERELDEPREIGGYNEDRDGPVKFTD